MQDPAVAERHAHDEQHEGRPQRPVAAVAKRDHDERDSRGAGDHWRDIAQREREIDLRVEVVGVGKRSAKGALARVEIREHADANYERPGREVDSVSHGAQVVLSCGATGEQHHPGHDNADRPGKAMTRDETDQRKRKPGLAATVELAGGVRGEVSEQQR